MKKAISIILIINFIFFGFTVVYAEPNTLPAEVEGQMIGRGLHSESSMEGDEVEVELLEPINLYNQRVFIPRSSVVSGRVLKVEEAGRGLQKGKIRVVFNRIIYPNGFTLGTKSYIAGTETAKGKPEEEQIKGKLNWKQKLMKTGKVATGIILGGPVGGAIAAGTIVFDKGGRIKIRPGEPVRMHIASIDFVDQNANVEGVLEEISSTKKIKNTAPMMPNPKPIY